MLRPLRWIIASLVLLAVLFVGANVIVKRVAEAKLASAVKDAFHLPTEPSVDIGGFPVILDILRGKVQRVSFTASDADVEDLKIEEVVVVLTGVRASGGFLHGPPPAVTVAAGTMTGRVTEASINSLLAERAKKATLTFHAGTVVARASRDFLGVRRTLVATGTIAREGGSLVFHPSSVTVDGRPPPFGTEALAKQKATISVVLPALPGGISSYDVAAVEGALAITATLRDATVDLSA